MHLCIILIQLTVSILLQNNHPKSLGKKMSATVHVEEPNLKRAAV